MGVICAVCVLLLMTWLIPVWDFVFYLSQFFEMELEFGSVCRDFGKTILWA